MEKDAQTKLLETATLLFSQKGFHAVSIRELARTAKINSALISYYFGGKEGLYQEVLEEQFTLIASLIESLESMPPRLSPIEGLRMYADNIAIIHRQRPFLTKFLMSEIINPTPCGEKIIKKYLSRVFLFISTVIGKGVASGEFKSNLNGDYATISLAGIMNFFFLSKPIFQEFTSLEEGGEGDYTSQAIDTFLNGIIRRKDDE
jgi:AcrR family transcriptional regulator